MDQFSRVRQLVHDVSGVPEEQITLDSTADQLHLDSLDLAELVMNVEEEFDVLIEDDAAIHSVNDLLHCLELTA